MNTFQKLSSWLPSKVRQSVFTKIKMATGLSESSFVRSSNDIYEFFEPNPVISPDGIVFFKCILCTKDNRYSLVRSWNHRKLSPLVNHLLKIHKTASPEYLRSLRLTTSAQNFFYETIRGSEHPQISEQDLPAEGCEVLKVGSRQIGMEEFIPDSKLVYYQGLFVSGVANGNSVYSQHNIISKLLRYNHYDPPSIATTTFWLYLFAELFVVRNIIEVKGKPVTITIDMWNPPACSKIVGNCLVVTGHYILSSSLKPRMFLMGLVEMATEKSESIQEQLKKIIDYWQVTVVMCVTDSASSIRAIKSLSLEEARCAAHTLSLCSSSALKECDMLKSIVETLNSLAKWTRTRAQEKLKFHEIQTGANKDAPTLQIFTDVPTRFNSTWVVINRAVRLRESIQDYSTQNTGLSGFPGGLENESWEFLSIACDLLAPMKYATDILSGYHFSSGVHLPSVIRNLLVMYRIVSGYFPEASISYCFGVNEEELNDSSHSQLVHIHRLKERIASSHHSEALRSLALHLWSSLHIRFVCGLVGIRGIRDVMVRVADSVREGQYFDDTGPLQGVSAILKIASYFDPLTFELNDLHDSEKLMVHNSIREQASGRRCSQQPIQAQASVSIRNVAPINVQLPRDIRGKKRKNPFWINQESSHCIAIEVFGHEEYRGVCTPSSVDLCIPINFLNFSSSSNPSEVRSTNQFHSPDVHAFTASSSQTVPHEQNLISPAHKRLRIAEATVESKNKHTNYISQHSPASPSVRSTGVVATENSTHSPGITENVRGRDRNTKCVKANARGRRGRKSPAITDQTEMNSQNMLAAEYCHKSNEEAEFPIKRANSPTGVVNQPSSFSRDESRRIDAGSRDPRGRQRQNDDFEARVLASSLDSMLHSTNLAPSESVNQTTFTNTPNSVRIHSSARNNPMGNKAVISSLVGQKAVHKIAENHSEDIDSEMRGYAKAAHLYRIDKNSDYENAALEFWSNFDNQQLFPKLWKVCKYYLTTLSTSTASESAFSRVSHILSKKRKKASIGLLRAILTLVITFVEEPQLEIDARLISKLAVMVSSSPEHVGLLKPLEQFTKFKLNEEMHWAYLLSEVQQPTSPQSSTLETARGSEYSIDVECDHQNDKRDESEKENDETLMDEQLKSLTQFTLQDYETSSIVAEDSDYCEDWDGTEATSLSDMWDLRADFGVRSELKLYDEEYAETDEVENLFRNVLQYETRLHVM